MGVVNIRQLFQDILFFVFILFILSFLNVLKKYKIKYDFSF